MKWKLGISVKLVLILFVTGLVLLICIGSLQYHYEVKNADRQLEKESDAILERLSVNLSQLVYEFNIKGVAAVVTSEFSNQNVAGIIVWDPTKTDMHFEYGRLQDDKSVRRESVRYMKKTKKISFMDYAGAGSERFDIALIELFMDRQKLKEQVLTDTTDTIVKFAAVIAFLLAILAVIIQKLLVYPLDKIRYGMEEAMSRILSDEKTVLYQVPVKLSESAFKRGFKEIRRMAECFENMSEAITERQNEISESRDSLRITLQSIGDAVIATDIETRIQMINSVAERLTGWSMDRAFNRHIEEVLRIIDSKTKAVVANPVTAAIQFSGVIPLALDSVLISPDGVELSVSGTCSPIRGADGRVVGAVLVFRDMTQARRMEEQLHQARKMDVIGQLAGGVAHDFNNMLGGIIGNAELLSFSLPEDSNLKKYVDTIIKGSERAADLTRKLLAFSRKAKIITTPLDIHEQIRSALALLERSIDPRIKIITRLEATSSVVASDPSLLQNAFLNLALNARDAMPEGGSLTFATSNILLDSEYCNKQPYKIEPGMYLEISISDTGVGMAKEIMEKVFEPFFTTKPVGQGTGLGLAAVYGTVKDHQGAINVYSEPGLGSVFKIYLPVEAATPVCAPSDEECVFSETGGCILVVDDEAIIRNTAHALLVSLGYDVILASDGDEALKSFLIEKERISAVILDIVMPKMNGREVYQHIREIDPYVPVIFSSGFSSESIISDLMGLGASAFIQKPYRQASLAKTLSEVLSP